MSQFEVLGQMLGRTRLFLIGGPCVLEGREMALNIARFMQATCARLDLPYVFKSSYDKANRTSWDSFRGPGLKEGLDILAAVRAEIGVPVLTDVHTVEEAREAAGVVDILQIPAFLARQTDLLVAVGMTGKPVNLKKAQFMAPRDMLHAIEKVRQTKNHQIMVTERGTQFGYNNLVVDMRAIDIMAEFGLPVVFDATHSVQLPGGQGTSSGGQRQFVAPLARAAVAAGAHGVFLEMHEDPDRALSDGPNSLPLTEVPQLLEDLLKVYQAVHDRMGDGVVGQRNGWSISGIRSRSRVGDLDATLRARILPVRLMVFDVDGVLTDGRVIYHDDGSEIKAFDVQDGHGIKLLQRAGIDVALITGRSCRAVDHRAPGWGSTRYTRVPSTSWKPTRRFRRKPDCGMRKLASWAMISSTFPCCAELGLPWRFPMQCPMCCLMPIMLPGPGAGVGLPRGLRTAVAGAGLVG